MDTSYAHRDNPSLDNVEADIGYQLVTIRARLDEAVTLHAIFSSI